MPDIINKQYAYADPADLIPHPENPRVGDVAAIAESIEANGFYGALVVQRSTGHVLVGNHRLAAAVELGLDRVPVVWADVDDDRARRILLADNKSADLAYYDDESLASVLASFDDDLLGTLYSDADLDVLAALDLGGDAEVGDARDALTPADRAEDYAASGIRSIIIPLSIADYDDLVARLVQLRSELDLDSNAEVITQLVRDATE